jgi:hypothetical protein
MSVLGCASVSTATAGADEGEVVREERGRAGCPRVIGTCEVFDMGGNGGAR